MELKRLIKSVTYQLLPSWLKRETINRNLIKSNIYFSQEGEDIILNRFFGSQKNGFFIDIGAHHPTRFSNTYLFYLKGWRGINIDAAPGSMKEFLSLRPEDINLEIPISDKEELLTFHIFNEPALNTFSEEEAKKKDGLREYKIIERKKLKTHRLSDVLDQHINDQKEIDFMSIDVEGLDIQVLRSNNWTRYRPKIILVEALNSSLQNISSDEVFLFLKKQGYELIAKTFNTLFFKRND